MNFENAGSALELVMIKKGAAIGLVLGLVSSAQAAFLERNALKQADPIYTSVPVVAAHSASAMASNSTEVSSPYSH